MNNFIFILFLFLIPSTTGNNFELSWFGSTNDSLYDDQRKTFDLRLIEEDEKYVFLSQCPKYPNISNWEGKNVFSASLLGRDSYSIKTIAGLVSNQTILCSYDPTTKCCIYFWKIQGLFLGKVSLHVSPVESQENSSDQLSSNLLIIVTRKPRIISKIFIITIVTFVFICTIAFGCKIDLDVIKQILKRPIAPIIGFFSQYLIMPVLAFSFIKIFQVDNLLAIGLFAVGASPGGGGSNVWTVLLDGDLSLSLTMTFISTTAALVMMPTWLYTVGVLFLDHGISIPYRNIFTTLGTLTLALGIGLLIRRFKPETAQTIATKCIRPTALLFVIFVFTFGVWANLYMFYLMVDWRIILGGIFLPWCGALFGGIAATICCQSWTRVKTIAIETSVQNTGIAIILMNLSLPQPEADISSVFPVACAIFTPIPFGIMLLIQTIYKRCCKSPEEDTNGHAKLTDNAENENLNNQADLEKNNDPSSIIPATNFPAA